MTNGFAAFSLDTQTVALLLPSTDYFDDRPARDILLQIFPSSQCGQHISKSFLVQD